MRYTIEEKNSKQEAGKAPQLLLGMWSPNRAKWIVLPVEQSDFDRFDVGDEIEMLITKVTA
jgi:hypothetical protein